MALSRRLLLFLSLVAITAVTGTSEIIVTSGVTFSGDAVPRIDNVDVLKLVAVARSLVPRSANGQVAAADATATASNGYTVRMLAQCATDSAPAECARCLRDSSLQMAKSWRLTLTAGVDVQGSVAAVLGPNCYLRFEISAPPLPVREKIREYCYIVTPAGRIVKDNIVLTVCIGFIVAGVIILLLVHVCRLVTRKLGNAAAAPASTTAILELPTPMALSRRLLLFLSLVAITAGTGTSEMIVTRC
ncbi:hypothetical protein TRIUR3_35386 [Triticum urartu]|uniref:Uncharacterized protein n=1 Tax=Triticum urartu TaxID=4572 RepID=M7ZWR1_TRIUA|nr:hypothetical protein TRIUR3_35386 [Triticum urartu]